MLILSDLVLLVLTVRRACRIWGCSVWGQHSQQHRPWSMGLSFLGLFENRTSVGGRASIQICSEGKLLCILLTVCTYYILLAKAVQLVTVFLRAETFVIVEGKQIFHIYQNSSTKLLFIKKKTQF